MHRYFFPNGIERYFDKENKHFAVWYNTFLKEFAYILYNNIDIRNFTEFLNKNSEMFVLDDGALRDAATSLVTALFSKQTVKSCNRLSEYVLTSIMNDLQVDSIFTTSKNKTVVDPLQIASIKQQIRMDKIQVFKNMSDIVKYFSVLYTERLHRGYG
jgi:hypothetical protein